MPIRTATLTHQIQKNGARLHRAMAISAGSHGPDQPPSELELAMLEERRLLKQARAQPPGAGPAAQAQGRKAGEGGQTAQGAEGLQAAQGGEGAQRRQGGQGRKSLAG